MEPLRTISKYTPASPEVKQAAVTAPKPVSGLMIWIWTGAASWALPTGILTDLCGVVLAEVVCIWTIPTPKARKQSAIHLVVERDLRKRTTEKAAVVRIFI